MIFLKLIWFLISALLLVGIFWGGLPMGASAQTLGNGDPVTIPASRLIFGFVISVVFAYLIAILIKRKLFGSNDILKPLSQLYGKKDQSNNILIKDKKRINAQLEIIFFECSGTNYLILSSPNHTHVLHQQQVAPDTGSDGR